MSVVKKRPGVPTSKATQAKTKRPKVASKTVSFAGDSGRNRVRTTRADESDGDDEDQDEEEDSASEEEIDHQSTASARGAKANEGEDVVVDNNEEDDEDEDEDDDDTVSDTSDDDDEGDDDATTAAAAEDEDDDGQSGLPPRPRTNGTPSASAEGAGVRLSAATLKTRMLPYMLQSPIGRRKIWMNLQMMMERRGYRWVAHASPPADHAELLPNNKGFLGTFYMHAVDTTPAKREPVYVMFCSKAGDPTLQSLTFPSRHAIVVADSLTGRARAVIKDVCLKAPPSSLPETEGSKVWTGEELKELYIEAFSSSFMMFDLLKQRYLRTVEFRSLPEDSKELEQVMNLFERARDKSHFPRMFDTDPVARYMRLNTGDILKQQRLSTSAGVHNSFRCIVGAGGTIRSNRTTPQKATENVSHPDG